MLDNKRGWARLALASAILAATLPVAAAPPVATSSEAQPPVVSCGLEGKVFAGFAALPANASLEDHEGAVLDTVSDECPNPQVVAELEAMLTIPTLTKLQRTAIENVLRSLRSGQLKRGTGAVGTPFSSSPFASPAVGGGGGSSGYTRE